MANNPLVNLGDLSKPVTVLIEKISKAVGIFYEPRRIKKAAKAESEAAKIRAESEAEVAKIKAQSDIEVTDLQGRTVRRVIVGEERNQKNMEQILAKAVPQVNDDANTIEMDEDWIANFFDKSRLVSDSEMQTLWSKILAGEANSPGNFSKRTVNFVAELEKNEADLFTNLCNFCWKFDDSLRPLIFDETAKIYNRLGINFESLSHLDSIGLIQFNSIAGYMQKFVHRKGNVFYHNRPLHFEMPTYIEKNDTHIGKVLLTSVGEQLAAICESNPVDGFYDYVKWQWRHYLPWSDEFFKREHLLPEILNLCSSDEHFSGDKWNALYLVFSRGGYRYSLPSQGPRSLDVFKKDFSARIAPFSEDEISRIRFGDVQINIPNSILYDAVKFNSQNEWVKSGALYVNLRVSQMLCLCVLLYPEGLQDIEIIKRKAEDYLLSIISPPNGA